MQKVSNAENFINKIWQFHSIINANYEFEIKHFLESVHDKMFLKTFENVYTSQELQVDWYFTTGNHDWDDGQGIKINKKQQVKTKKLKIF